MATQSGSMDFVLIHKPRKVVCHRCVVDLVCPIGGADVPGVENVHVALLDDLSGGRGTLFWGLEKKGTQFSTLSKNSGKKIKL